MTTTFEINTLEKIRNILGIQDGILSPEFIRCIEEIKHDAERHKNTLEMICKMTGIQGKPDKYRAEDQAFNIIYNLAKKSLHLQKEENP